MRTVERLANSGAASLEGDILDKQYNSIQFRFVNIEVKYHLKAKSTTTNQIHFFKL